MALRIVLAIGIVLVIAVLASEVRGWRSGARILTRKQKTLRVASACIMIAIMGMIMAGSPWDVRENPLGVLAYWAVCIGLALSLVALALLDIREVGLTFGEQRKRILKDLTEPDDAKPDSR